MIAGAVLILEGSVRSFCLSFRTKGILIAREEQDKLDDKKIGRTFGLAFAAKGGLVFIAVNLLYAVALDNSDAPARLFNAPIYYTTGIASIVVGAAYLILPDALVRENLVGCCKWTILWITSVKIDLVALNAGRQMEIRAGKS